MAAIVVPFRGASGKTRLSPLPAETRAALMLAMLADVLAACVVAGETTVVTADDRGREVAVDAGASVVDDPGGGQGAAVAAAVADLPDAPVVVVNADVPCVVPDDVRALARAIPPDGIALVEADDGTTNALGLSAPRLFEPLYGPRSGRRFAAHASALGGAARSIAIPNLADDVDTLLDLERVELRLGPHTRGVVAPPVGARP